MIRCRQCGTLVNRAVDPTPSADHASTVGTGTDNTGAGDNDKSSNSDEAAPTETDPESDISVASADNPPSSADAETAAEISSPDCDTEDSDAADRDAADVQGLGSPGSDDSTAPAGWYRLGMIRKRRIISVIALVVVFGLLARGVWSVVTARPPGVLAVYAAPDPVLTLVTFSRDGRFVLAGSSDGRVFAWEQETGTRTTLGETGEGSIIALAVADDGFVVAGDDGQQLVGWLLDKPQAKARRIAGLRASLTCVAFLKKKGRKAEAVLGLADGSLVFLTDAAAVNRESGHLGSVKSIAVDNPRGQLITAGADGRLIWRVGGDHEIADEVSAHATEIGAMALSSNRQEVATGDWNGEIRLWNLADHQELQRWSQPDAVSGLVFAGDYLVTASWDGWLRFWQVDHDEPVHLIDTGHVLHDLAVNPQRDRIATVSDTSDVEIWELP